MCSGVRWSVTLGHSCQGFLPPAHVSVQSVATRLSPASLWASSHLCGIGASTFYVLVCGPVVCRPADPAGSQRTGGTFTQCLVVEKSRCQLVGICSTPARAILHTVTYISRWQSLSSRRRPSETTRHRTMLTHCLDDRRNGTFTWCLDVRGSQCQLATEPTSSTPARATLNIVTCINGWLRLSSRRRPLPTPIRQPVLTLCLDGRHDSMLAVMKH
jgi:hypothetical protein